MAFGPRRASPPHDTVTKEEPAEPVAGPGEILDHVTARATQVAHSLLGGRRDGDGSELTGPVQPGQSSGVAAVGLDPIARALGDQGGGHHVAAHPHRSEQALEVITGRARLVAGPDLLGLAQPFDQASDRVSVVEDLVDLCAVTIGRKHRHRDRVLRDVHPQVDESSVGNTGHGWLLPSVCRLRSPTGE